MKHWVGFLFIGSLILAFFSPLFLMQWLVETPVVNQPELRLIRYSFTLSNNSNELIENATFTTFAPVSETPFQRVEKIQANERFELVLDSNGNQKLSFEISELPPYGQKVISISADLSVWPRDSSGSVLKGGTSPLVGAKQTSASLAFDAVQAVSNTNHGHTWMRAANSWVHENLQDIGYVSEDRGALYALTEQKGDCTEFMWALVALARMKEVPALAVAGFRVRGRGSVVKTADYHNWAFFQSGKGWQQADPYEGAFDTLQGDYIAFRILAEVPEQKSNSQRFYSYDSRLSVSMN